MEIGRDFNALVDADLEAVSLAISRDRFILERQPDGSWSFGAPATISYSARPGQMSAGETALQAVREWIQANSEDTAP